MKQRFTQIKQWRMPPRERRIEIQITRPVSRFLRLRFPALLSLCLDFPALPMAGGLQKHIAKVTVTMANNRHSGPRWIQHDLCSFHQPTQCFLLPNPADNPLALQQFIEKYTCILASRKSDPFS